MTGKTLQQWLQHLERQHPKTIDLGLERIQRVADKLLPAAFDASVITVAGTNGKGSFVASMAAILQAHGKHVGCYTSPHLLYFNERITINGIMVDDDAIVRAFENIEAVRGGVSLSYFEFTTLAALLVFSQQRLDYILLEVGLGGRLDAVNIIDPDWAVITSIGLDHQQYLGDTRSSIAAEKAGILREKTPLICAEADFIKLYPAVDNGRQLCLIGRDYEARWHGSSWQFSSGGVQDGCELPDNGLSCNSQAAAIMLASQLDDLGLDMSLTVRVLTGLQLPGRFQRFVSENHVTVIADVAHNTQAAALLHQRLRAASVQGKRRMAVFHMLDDKDTGEVLNELAADFDAWYVGGINHARASDTGTLASQIRQYTGRPVYVSATIVEAFASALTACSAGDELVAFGSFFVVAELLPELERL